MSSSLCSRALRELAVPGRAARAAASRSRRLRILPARMLAAVAEAVCRLTEPRVPVLPELTRDDLTFEATDEGRPGSPRAAAAAAATAAAAARWLDELMAVEARKFARLTCWADADLCDSRSRVLDMGLYEPYPA